MAFDVVGARRAGYSDAEIAQHLAQQKKFDLQGATKAGYSPSEIIDHLNPIPQEKGSILDAPRDISLALGKGATQGIRSLTDIAGTENVVSKNLRGFETYLGGLQSASAKRDYAEMARIAQEAEDKGFGEQVKAALKQFGVAPGMMLAQGVGSIAPTVGAALLTGGLSAEGEAAALAAKGASAAVGAAQGVGSLKGSIRDAVYQEYRNQGLSEDQAVDAANKAQSYSGGNIDLLLEGGALGAFAASTGIESTIAKKIGERVAKRIGVQGAKEVAEKKAEESLLRSGVKGFLKEGSTEGLQGGQEQMAQNVALQREGVNVPTMRGVVTNAALEGFVGGLLGSGVDIMKTTGDRAAAEKQNNRVKAAVVASEAAAAEPTDENVAFAMKAYQNAGASEEEARDVVLEVFKRIKESGTAPAAGATTAPNNRGRKPSVPPPVGGEGGVGGEPAGGVENIGTGGLGESSPATGGDADPTADIKPPLAEEAASAGLTPETYVDRYLAGEGRGDTPADLEMQQYAANDGENIKAEFDKRAQPPPPPASTPTVTIQDIATPKLSMKARIAAATTLVNEAVAATGNELPATPKVKKAKQAAITQLAQAGAKGNVDGTPLLKLIDDHAVPIAPVEEAAPVEETASKSFKDLAAKTRAARAASVTTDEDTPVTQVPPGTARGVETPEVKPFKKLSQEVKENIGNAAFVAIEDMPKKKKEAFLAAVTDVVSGKEPRLAAELETIYDVDAYKAGVQLVADYGGPDFMSQYEGPVQAVDYSARESLPATDVTVTPEQRAYQDIRQVFNAARNNREIDDAQLTKLKGMFERRVAPSQILGTLELAKAETEARVASGGDRPDMLLRPLGTLDELAPNRRNFITGLAAAMGASATDAATLPRTTMAGNIAIREALKTGKLQNVIDAIYASTNNPTLKEVARLLKLGGVGDAKITVEDYGDAELAVLGSTLVDNGDVTLYKTSNGISGDTLETALHEALHSFLARRYRSLNTYKAYNRELVGTRKQQGDEFIDAFNDLHRAFRRMMLDKFPELLNEDNEATVWALEAWDDPDELFVRSLTDPDLQAFLKTIDINGDKIKTSGKKSLWDRFVDMIAKLFNIQRPQAKTALNEIMDASYSVLKAGALDQPTGEFSKAVLTYNNQESELLEKAPKTPKTPKTPSLNEAIRKLKVEQGKTSVGLRKLQKSQDAFYGSSGDLIKRTMELLDEGLGTAIKAHDAADVNNVLKTDFVRIPNNIFKVIANALPTTGLIDWVRSTAGEDFAAPMDEVSNLVNRLIGEKGRLRRQFAKIGNRFDKFVGLYGQKALSSVYANRINRVDPTAWPTGATLAQIINSDTAVAEYNRVIADPKTDTAKLSKLKEKLSEREGALREAYAAWEKLGTQTDGQAIYKDLINFYRTTYDQRREGLDNNLRGLGLNKETTENLIANLRLEMEQARKGVKDEDEADIDDSFFPDQYVPFNRYGEYWISIPKSKGVERQFYVFEDAKERNRALKRLVAEVGASNVKVGDTMSELRTTFNTETAAMKKMLEILDKALEEGSIDKETLRDQLYQVLLMTTPERSIRRQFLHSNEVIGFSTDVQRGFSDSAVRHANELASLKYRQKIDRQLEQITGVFRTKQNDVRPELQAKLTTVAQSLRERAQNSLSPTPAAAITDILNRTSFIYYLTSAATAMVQFTGIPIRVMPRLSVDYGYIAATAKVAKFAQIWKSVGVKQGDTFIPVTMENSKLVTEKPANKWAFQQLQDLGAFEGASTAVLRNRRTLEAGAKRSQQQVLETVEKAISSLFVSSEMLSRQATSMMAFELEYEKLKKSGANEDAAREGGLKAASKITKDTLGDYSEFERPPVMKGELARSLFLFKMYSVNTTRFFVSNLRAMFKGRSLKERVDAGHELAGVLLMGAMFHGLTGMPLYGLICTTLDLLAKMDDDDEKRKRAAENPYTADSADARFRMDWLPNHFGNPNIQGTDGRMHTLANMLQFGAVSELTNVNLGSRTSFNGLWFRPPRPSETSEEMMTNLVVANVPFASMFSNAGRAMDAFGSGEVVRGIEALSPAFIRGAATAYRLGTEGAENTRGDDVVKRGELNNADLAAQVLGLQPTLVADYQKQVATIKGEMFRIDKQRGVLMRRFNTAVANPEGKRDDVISAIEAIRKHNGKYPQPNLQIDAEDIENSYKTFVRNSGMSYRGVLFGKGEAADVLDAFNLLKQ